MYTFEAVFRGIIDLAFRIGVDVAQYYSVDDWKCVIDHGRRFAIVRGWHSYGGFDE